MRLSKGILALGLFAAAGSSVACAPAYAAPASDLKDWDAGMFGRYGPGGDCGSGPVIQIDETGPTYEVGGETIHPATFEIAHTFWGNFYEGIQTVFMPFIRGANDFGNSIMIVNAEEVEGKVTFESNGPVSAAEQALAGASPYLRCGAAPAPASASAAAATAPAPVAAIPLDWAALPRVEDSFEQPFDMFERGEIAQALRALIGGRMAALERNLSVRGPIRREGSIYHISGNAQHMGGEEQAYVLMDAARKRVQVGLWEKGKLTVYAPQQGRLFMPAEIEQMLLRSPPEDAVALPGTPWEVIYTSDRLPLATVDAAGSPDIRSFSLFCDQGRPKLAMLLNKPRGGNALISTWVFNGRLVDVAMGRGNGEGTFWLGWLDGSPLPQMLVGQSGEAFLRIDGGLQGQASLSGSSAVVRGVLSQCLRL